LFFFNQVWTFELVQLLMLNTGLTAAGCGVGRLVSVTAKAQCFTHSVKSLINRTLIVLFVVKNVGLVTCFLRHSIETTAGNRGMSSLYDTKP